jgi:hypothetical protein
MEMEVSSNPDIGYSLNPVTIQEQVLESTTEVDRVISIDSIGSSVYASSEGETGESEYGLDSLELPRLAGAAEVGGVGGGDWLRVVDDDDGLNVGVRGVIEGRRKGNGGGGVGVGRNGNLPFRQGRAWEDKPSFFEYLYGS